MGDTGTGTGPDTKTGADAAPEGETAHSDGDIETDSDTEERKKELTDKELRRRVEEEYDFENFGPAEMNRMSAREWEVSFDDSTWITGVELLDRVEEDLNARVADRDVFAVVERVTEAGAPRLLAYSDEGYAVIFPDGSVAGFGTVLRDVKPVVALCSMDTYDPLEAPADAALLPHPEEVPQGTGEFGNLMLQLVAGALGVSGLALFVAWMFSPGNVLPLAGAVLFVLGAVFLFATVANARLSDRFRAEEYRNRLRSVGLEDGERPDFLPLEDGKLVDPIAHEDADREAAPIPGADGDTRDRNRDRNRNDDRDRDDDGGD